MRLSLKTLKKNRSKILYFAIGKKKVAKKSQTWAGFQWRWVELIKAPKEGENKKRKKTMETMSEMIRIEPRNFSGENINSVDARGLWVALESQRQFADWFKDRVEKCGLVEGVDYVGFSQICEKPSGGRPGKDYALSIDAAKHVAMLEGNARGKQIRMYFIESEKKFRALASVPTTFLEAMELVVLKEKERLLLETRTRELETAVAVKNTVIRGLQTDADYCREVMSLQDKQVFMTEVAAHLSLSAIELNKWLSAEKIIREFSGGWIPYAEYGRRGFFDIFLKKIPGGRGGEVVKKILVVTPDGMRYIIQRRRHWEAVQAKAAELVECPLFKL